MDTLSYEMDVVYPCADYEGVTVEGRFKNIEFSNIYDSFKLITNNISLLKSANMIICGIDNAKIYIYEDGKFVISRIQSKTTAEKIVCKVLFQNKNKYKGDVQK